MRAFDHIHEPDYDDIYNDLGSDGWTYVLGFQNTKCPIDIGRLYHIKAHSSTGSSYRQTVTIIKSAVDMLHMNIDSQAVFTESMENDAYMPMKIGLSPKNIETIRSPGDPLEESCTWEAGVSTEQLGNMSFQADKLNIDHCDF